MKLIIHRGTKEIGGSCVELRADNSRILIDFGMPLVNDMQEPFDSKILAGKSIDELKELNILPHIKGLYKNEEKGIDGIVISHSHMDHYGFLDYVNQNIPVYMSQGAKELIDITNIFISGKSYNLDIHIIENNRTFKIGDFTIKPYTVDHSAFDARAFLIEAGDRRMFYSADFRGHGRKSKLFGRIIRNPPKDIDCLLMEGSMMGRGRQAYENEEAIQTRIEKILETNNNITFLFCSSQNIDRLVSAYKACLRTDSIFVIDIYTAFILDKLKKISPGIPQFDWRNIRVKFLHHHAGKLAESGHKELLYLYNKRKIEMDEISQNKDRILMLARDNSVFPIILNNIDQPAGSIIIYSMWQGYLKPEFKKYCRCQDLIIEQVHTSGHAILKDLKLFAQALNPKLLVPIHTFDAEKYPDFFQNVRILKDGEELELKA